MEFHGGDKVEACSEEEGFLGSYYAATAAKNLVEEEDMSKHLIETHHKPSAKTHRWSTLLNGLNLRTHPTPKPLTRPLKPSPPLLLIFFFFKPNPFLVDGATISFVTISNARFLLDVENQNHIGSADICFKRIKFVDPLLQSPIVSDVAYETLVKLSRCTTAPLCHWALDIANALRLIVTKDVSVFLDLIPIAGDREAYESPSLGLFERIINGLSMSCKPGPLPVDSFTFVFPIMEHILLSPKKTGLHDDVLRILYLHMDPLLPLPRLRKLSALYHVLGVVPAYQGSIGPALNELCLGLQPEEVAPALYGVYAKDVHVRMAYLNAIKCIPAVASRSVPENVEVATSLWIALHDPEKVGSVIKNPEISSFVPTFLMGLTDPNEYTKYSFDILVQTTFINSIDAPSLALLVPIVHRGLRERSAETKKKAAQIVGNMCSLVTEPKDMIPYIGLLLPEVKKVLGDPIPEVRNVEHSGAAQGLSEVLSALGTGYFEHVLPDIIQNCSHQKASVHDGYLTLFKYLPRSLGVQFQNYLQQVLPAILDGLADENESVRDAALGAGHVLVEHYATTYAFIVLPCFFVFSWRWIEIYFCSYMSLPLLLPAVEDGIFNDNWRIRQSSVELLGGLLFKVAGTSGKALLEGGSDDEGSSTEAHGHAIIEVLGRDKRNEILVALYMVQTDVSLFVRQAALHVWKTIVANTPKTLKEIMPVLMNTLISSLASSSSERRQVCFARALGELVRKLGERVLPLIIPILSQGLKNPNAGRRQVKFLSLAAVVCPLSLLKLPSPSILYNKLNPTGRYKASCGSNLQRDLDHQGVCIGLSEVMASAVKSQLLSFMDELIPT
ncbi:hypothetical protein POTOM_059140 [Populus tomentosa]|uniref:ILITYHIA n=1 Tax=Populus tomentosa TaxID=118781 RepID=A0A8X7XVL3_POPTO|nr:hypothetical protein POTOM_059140 [Populus tomentosa]